MAGEKLAKAIQETARKQSKSSESVDLLYGVVLSTSPLQIEVDSRYIIKDSLIKLSSLCIEKKITYNTDEIVLWRGLQVGDSVNMLRVHGGQLFYVLEREGGLTI